jgi:hypothetical protein
MAVSYSLWSFGIFFPFWYVWTKKHLATLVTLLKRSFCDQVETCFYPCLSSIITKIFHQVCQMVHIVAYQNPKFWYSWEGLGTENLSKYNGHLCSTLWLFVIFTFVIAIKFFPVFVHTYIHMLFQENSGNPVFHSLIIRKSFRVSLKQLISSIASSLRLSHPYASLFTYLDANPFVCMLAKFSANLR